MPTLEGENATSACAEHSERKSSSVSPKLNSNDSSSINSLQDSRYLNSNAGAANININLLETPTLRTSTTVVQATASLITDQNQKLEKENQIVHNCHSRNHNHFHYLTSSPVAIDNSQRFHNANDCSNNGQSVMATTTTVLSTSLASFNGNSNINNNGNPNATATNNSITCNSNHNSNFNTITNNSGSVCHTNINEMNNSTKVADPSPKMTSKTEHVTTDGIAPTSAFVKPQQLEQPLYVSHEDVTSVVGSSSLNSQVLLNASNNGNNNNNQNATMVSTLNASSQTNTTTANNNNLSGILKGSKENLLQNNCCNGSMGGSNFVSGTNSFPEKDDPGDGLGPLPPKWETAYTERGELYFIDHNTGTSHWLDPRLSKFQKKSLEECGEDELPYGWEKIEDSLYGTYYIDHVNRRTQYENPVLEAKRRAAEQRQKQQSPHQQQQVNSQQRPQTPSSQSILNGAGASTALSSVSSGSTMSTVDISQRAMHPPPPGELHNANRTLLPYKFTRNPSEMQGERITRTLLKSARGLGITIVGGDDGVEEFLQIKSIVPNGPAWLDGRLQMGDVLVYVNDTCVLGFSHHEMVNVFQSIMPGETVTLEICRGYPLPFDPNDPNTEVVTTIAVDGLNSESEKQGHLLMDLNMDGNYNFLDSSIGSNSNPGNKLSTLDTSGFILMKKPELHTISILKGAMGFGFTIADSAFGQKVKKILDRACCNELQEGDILLEINDIDVKNKSHLEVVQILKDCSKTEPTSVKIQRSTKNSNSVLPNSSTTVAESVAKLRKNFMGTATGIGSNALFRSKTPTADLYSTMQKEILPIRPKTPLVDTRCVRTNSSGTKFAEEQDLGAVDNSNVDNGPVEQCSLTESKSQLTELNKSRNSLSEAEIANHDIPFMDPYPKMVSSLSERLACVSMPTDGLPPSSAENGYLRTTASGVPNYENQSDYISTGSGNCSSIYGLAQMPPIMSPLSGGLYGQQVNSIAPLGSMAPIAPIAYHYHHDSCFCCECQDYRNNRLRNVNSTHHPLPQQTFYTGYSIASNLHNHSPASLSSFQAAHFQNERMQKRVNELLSDRRRVGLSPLEHNHNLTNAPVNEYASSPMPQQPPPILHQHPQHPQHPQHSPVVSGISQVAGSNWHNNGMMQAPVALVRNGGLVESTDILDGSGEQYVLSEVTLQRQALGFGFRIVGGTEEGSQVTVGHIVPGGAADHNHRIATGDEILSIDGINVVNASHHKVVSLMGEAALRGQVTMILRRRARNTSTIYQNSLPVHLLQQSAMPRSTSAIHYSYDVIVTRHENEGFGFVIISSSNQYYGSTIGKLIPGSPADRCGELKVGDRILAVNRVNIAGMSHGEVVNLIKESGLHVRLTITCSKEGNSMNPAPVGSSNSLQLNSAQASPGQISQAGIENTDVGFFERPLLSAGSNSGSISSSTSYMPTSLTSSKALPTPPQL
ncbi:membrane associated guanylate kinase, WW and PDZ domain containing protein magi isoform 2-T4 [Glossina fuscipes fuscipes]